MADGGVEERCMTQHTDETEPRWSTMETLGELKVKEVDVVSPATIKSYIWNALALFYIIWLSRLNLLISVCGAVPYRLHSYHICSSGGIRAGADEIQ